MIKPIHPFPARMAPELAIRALEAISRKSVVLDLMSGSGTVLRQATQLGHTAIGIDMDPLAVLMAKVWTSPIDPDALEALAQETIQVAKKLNMCDIVLPWIDDDTESAEFIQYWFGPKQIIELRRLAFALHLLKPKRKRKAEADVLKIALSRIIITKDQGASLARDTSHSRPHKISEDSEYEVAAAFERSYKYVRKVLSAAPPAGNATVMRGDARSLLHIDNASVDMVLTSPPYLNAIDYMRGHRMALVWLGHKLSELRDIRSASIGAERGPDNKHAASLFLDIQKEMGDTAALLPRHNAMIARYSEDLYRMMSEIARVLKADGKAVLVVGNSCLKGSFISNSKGVAHAGAMVGLRLDDEIVRDLPDRHRYLPMPSGTEDPLGKRMRTESILTFCSAGGPRA